jgi:hypothetical protein
LDGYAYRSMTLGHACLRSYASALYWLANVHAPPQKRYHVSTEAAVQSEKTHVMKGTATAWLSSPPSAMCSFDWLSGGAIRNFPVSRRPVHPCRQGLVTWLSMDKLLNLENPSQQTGSSLAKLNDWCLAVKHQTLGPDRSMVHL